MALIVKMPASELPVKVEELTTENFIKKVIDVDAGELKFLGKLFSIKFSPTENVLSRPSAVGHPPPARHPEMRA